MRHPRIPRLVWSRIMKLVRIDGRWHVIRQWSTDRGYEIVPIGDTLARGIIIQGEDGLLRFDEALIAAGWLPPEDREHLLWQRNRLAGLLRDIYTWPFWPARVSAVDAGARATIGQSCIGRNFAREIDEALHEADDGQGDA